MATQNTKKTKIMLAKNLKASERFKDNLLEGAISLDVLDDPKVKELIYEYEGKRYLNVKVGKRKEVTDYGKTHYIEIDTFKPVKQEPKEGE